MYDVIVIGSGPGGYVAAIRCAQLGMKTALVEKYDTLGGTCLNVGCIPSKALLDSSEHFHNASHTFDKHGIDLNDLKVNLDQMMKRKNEVISQTCDGVKFLMDKNKIDVLHGLGSFIDKNTIEVTPKGKKASQYKSKNFIIATGSKPNFFPGMEPDKKRIKSIARYRSNGVEAYPWSYMPATSHVQLVQTPRQELKGARVKQNKPTRRDVEGAE